MPSPDTLAITALTIVVKVLHIPGKRTGYNLFSDLANLEYGVSPYTVKSFCELLHYLKTSTTPYPTERVLCQRGSAMHMNITATKDIGNRYNLQLERCHFLGSYTLNDQRSLGKQLLGIYEPLNIAPNAKYTTRRECQYFARAMSNAVAACYNANKGASDRIALVDIVYFDKVCAVFERIDQTTPTAMSDTRLNLTLTVHDIDKITTWPCANKVGARHPGSATVPFLVRINNTASCWADQAIGKCTCLFTTDGASTVITGTYAQSGFTRLSAWNMPGYALLTAMRSKLIQSTSTPTTMVSFTVLGKELDTLSSDQEYREFITTQLPLPEKLTFQCVLVAWDVPAGAAYDSFKRFLDLHRVISEPFVRKIVATVDTKTVSPARIALELLLAVATNKHSCSRETVDTHWWNSTYIRFRFNFYGSGGVLDLICDPSLRNDGCNIISLKPTKGFPSDVYVTAPELWIAVTGDVFDKICDSSPRDACKLLQSQPTRVIDPDSHFCDSYMTSFQFIHWALFHVCSMSHTI